MNQSILKHCLIFLISFASLCAGQIVNDPSLDYFPDDFKFGSASSAYQIEGGWDEDGKGPSIWDELTHDHPELIADHSNGNVGPYSYKYFKQDVAALKELGMNFYRFSVSWPRILPKGDISVINEAGIDYYNKLIDHLIENHIEPMITMYHWDLPVFLQKLGGLTNPHIVDFFHDYSNLLFSKFGDRVRYWITFNEPQKYCDAGHGKGIEAPLIHGQGIAEYLCGHNVLLAHADTYKLYREKYFEQQVGKVGISLNTRFFLPKNESNPNDVDAVERAAQFQLGWFAHPIFHKDGGYPDVMVKSIAENSRHQNYTRSRLPAITDDTKNFIRGSSDFLGLNYYTSRLVEMDDTVYNESSYENDYGIKISIDEKWMGTPSNKWLYSVPEGLRRLLNWIKSEYNNTEVMITENGFSDEGVLEDVDRQTYIREHLNAVLKAIREDGCNVKSHTTWCLVDNFEWLEGYQDKFGLFSVNLDSPSKERTPKKSVDLLKKIISTRRIPELF